MVEYIEFNHTDPDWEDPNYEWCWRVNDYEDEETLKYLVRPDDIISNHKSIKIRFAYPLSDIVELEFTNDIDYFTRKDFVRVVYEGYKHIYDTEKQARSSSLNGPFGIWGHRMEDLFLEGAEEVEPGVFKLGMGS